MENHCEKTASSTDGLWDRTWYLLMAFHVSILMAVLCGTHEYHGCSYKYRDGATKSISYRITF